MFMPPIKETEQNYTFTRKGNAYIISIHITYTYLLGTEQSLITVAT